MNFIATDEQRQLARQAMMEAKHPGQIPCDVAAWKRLGKTIDGYDCAESDFEALEAMLTIARERYVKRTYQFAHRAPTDEVVARNLKELDALRRLVKKQSVQASR